MANQFAFFGVALLLAGVCPAADQPARSAAAKTAAAPAGVPSYLQAAGGSSLEFSFEQAGAMNQGAFRQFATELAYDEKNPAASHLSVRVQIASLDTQDKDRDDTLASADLFDAAKFPTAQFVASSFTRRADDSLEAVGKLTLRGVTRDLRVPLKLRNTAAGLELSGETTIKRLDYGIGQGEWKSTEWVGDAVKLQYKVALVKAAGGAH